MDNVIIQGSPEWLAKRAGHATSSHFDDVQMKPTTAGYSNYKIKLILERITGKSLESGFKSQAMTDGNEREPLGRGAYEAATGNIVSEVDFIKHEFMEYVGCSPDGLIGDDGGFELKCPQPAAHYEYLLGNRLPPKYVPQVQGCLWITGRKFWDFASYNPDFPDELQLLVVRVYPDKAYIDGLKLAAAGFLSDVAEGVKTMEAMVKAKQ